MHKTPKIFLSIILGSVFGLSAFSLAAQAGCQMLVYKTNSYNVCRFNAGKDDIRLFHRDDKGEVLGSFGALSRLLDEKKQVLKFAMNAGMYDEERRPVGLYVEHGKQLKAINTRNGYGNFHLMPNGVFWVKGKKAGVVTSKSYVKQRIKPDFATQSGPMLVIKNKLHKRFQAQSLSLKIRNGVGVAADGKTVWFAVSQNRVNFHSFASLFRDRLKTPNALFLDGTVSKIYAPELNRSDRGLRMGPMVGVVEARKK